MGQIRQVILNLLLNSLDAVPQGGFVRVRVLSSVVNAETPGNWIGLEVEDNGCGLPLDLEIVSLSRS